MTMTVRSGCGSADGCVSVTTPAYRSGEQSGEQMVLVTDGAGHDIPVFGRPRLSKRKRTRAAPSDRSPPALATGVVSVVYWVPGPPSRPNPPVQPDEQVTSVRPTSPVLDCAATYP